MKKIKDFTTIILFALFVLAFCVSSIAVADKDVSYAERRKLKTFSETVNTSVFSNDFSSEIEEYFLDQMPLREVFRSINARVRYNLMRQSDVNGLWIENKSLFKKEEPFNEIQINYGINLINNLVSEKLEGMNVYYSVIPDKNYFIRDKKERVSFDYEKLFKMLLENIKGARYINITDTLSLGDYYRTDSHWSQDKIFKTAQRIASAMNMEKELTPEAAYSKKTLEPFYGVYYGQAALGTKPDEIVYMTSEFTENAKVYGIDAAVLKERFMVKDTLTKSVYALDKFGKMDSYDIFLSGAQPLVVIESENAKSDRELVIFRDSFSSSLAPLFTGAYKKITLVDLRYFPSKLLDEFVELNKGQDALFLYSSSLYNSSMLLK